MTGSFLDNVMKGHVPAWLLAGAILFILIGPQGFWRIIDRVFPPTTVVQAERVAQDLDRIESRSRKLDIILANQESIIRSITDIIARIESAKERLNDLNARISQLEIWRMQTTTRPRPAYSVSPHRQGERDNPTTGAGNAGRPYVRPTNPPPIRD